MGTVVAENNNKRDLDDSGCVADDISTKNQSRVQLLDFSDDVLLFILQFCSPRDLKSVGFTCERLNILIRDRSLWHEVDARREPSGTARFKWYLSNVLNADTKRLSICGHETRIHGCFHLRRAEPVVEDIFSKYDDKKTTNGFDTTTKSIDLNHLLREDDTNEDKKDKKNKFDDKNGVDNNKTPAKLVVTPKLLKMIQISCPNLEFIAIEYCRLDCKMTGVSMFPKNLKRLSLRGVECINAPVEKALLFKIHDYLPELEYLDLSECAWMEAVGLLPLSKMSSLKTLILQHCQKLNEFVAYASLAARYGFLALEVVDLRFTPVSDSEVSAFGWLPRLQELYLQCNETKEDRDVRVLEDELPNQGEAYEVLCDWETADNPESSENEDDSSEANPEARPAPEQSLPLNLSTWNRQDVFVIHNGPTAEVISMPFGPDRAEYRRTIEAIIPQRRNFPHLNEEFDLQRLNAANVTVRRIQPEAGPSTNGENDDKTPKNDDKDDEENGETASKRPKTEDNQPGCSTEEKPVLSEESDSIIELNDNVLVVNLSQGVKRKTEIDVSEDSLKRRRVVLDEEQPGPSNSNRENGDNSANYNGPSSSNGGPSGSNNDGPSSSNGGPSGPNSEPNNDGPSSSNGGPSGTNSEPNNDGPSSSNSGPSCSNSEPNNDGPSSSNGGPSSSNGGPSSSNNEPCSSNSDGPSSSGENQNDRKNIVVDVPNTAGPSNSLPQNGDAPQQRFVRFSLNDGSNNNSPNRCSIRDFFQRQGSCSVQMVIGHGAAPLLRSGSPLFEDHSTFVSDSSIRHFGESRLDDADYIHISSAWRRRGNNQPYGRPTRSNLRILSVRGYRQITDRSLNHLITAAPFLVRVDFRETGVTEAGVERFKSLRPEVEVLYTKEEKK